MFNTGLLAPFLKRSQRPPHQRIVHAPEPVQLLAQPAPEMRRFSSIEEFDEFDRELRATGDRDMVHILSNSYLVPIEIDHFPSDPFSEEYMQAVLALHARISGRSNYDARTMELSPISFEEMIATPSAYQGSSEWLGNHLESYGHVIKKLDVKPGMSVVEFGCGDAEISLHLARLGCSVTVVDIEKTCIDVVREKSQRMKLSIEAVHGGFDADLGDQKFDRAFFYQSYHHAIRHRELLNHIASMLKPDGFIVFGPEPIIDPNGPWRHAVPYPWGPRFDGLSLRAMRSYGWMELGFQEAYFAEMLRRAGWSYDLQKSETNGLVFSVTAKRLAAISR